MTKALKILITFILVVMSGLQSCEDSYGPVVVNEDEIIHDENGVFILNEGNYTVGNGSLSYYNVDSQLVSNNLFQRVNEIPLGDVVQSMVINDSTGFIVVNYSKKIEVININTYKHIATIDGFNSPRNIQIIDKQKAYVTELAGNSIKVIDIQNYMVIDQIDVGFTTEAILKINTNVFVTNWSYGNKVFIIDSENDLIIDSLVVTLEPNSIVVDKNNKVWVLSSGGFLKDEIPALTRINSETFEIEQIIEFPEIDMNPISLCINGRGDSLYFLNQHIYKMSITDFEIPEEPVIESSNRNFYTMSTHPNTSIIFVSDAKDYNQNGEVWVYNSQGDLINHFTVGVIPSGFCFE